MKTETYWTCLLPPTTYAEYNSIMLRENKSHLRDPPPKMDFKYESTCYPKECDREVIVSREGTDVHVMAGINIRQQVREKSRYLNAKGVVWMQQATQGAVTYCRICSQHSGMDGTLRIYNHRHHSSFVDRIFAHVDSYGRYFCIGCNENHPVRGMLQHCVLVQHSAQLEGKTKQQHVQRGLHAL